MDYEKTTDGGSAFPIQAQMYDCERQQLYSPTTPGMTLRDYFAAKALNGYIVASLSMDHDKIAEEAYRSADAMLKARGE